MHKGGFNEEDIRAAFDAAELEGYSFKVLMEVISHGRTAELFLAQGVKRNRVDVVKA